ncbi:hypothetical protein F5Y10DRAFT_261838 [Nemania abortiva]|nr:hypothetical protein F5Y10DRAFT_261838 [Nemania abortiva]
MPSGGKKKNLAILNKEEKRALCEYLERAGTQQAHVGNAWSREIQYIHGEGRITTKTGKAFHIGTFKGGDGNHRSWITIGGEKKKIEGTDINYGVDEPTMQQVFNAHKRQFGVDVRSPTPSDDEA